MTRRARSKGIGDLYALPGHLIRRCQQIAVALFHEECGPYDITPVQYAALMAIGATKDLDATRLSMLVAFDRSTLGNVLERLEEKQLISRHPSAQDKRIKTLKITEKGSDILKEVQAPVQRAQERILDPLEPDEQEMLMRLLNKMVDINNEHSRAPRKAMN
jgi:DNA-binding MarR family transcriptional regulator